MREKYNFRRLSKNFRGQRQQFSVKYVPPNYLITLYDPNTYLFPNRYDKGSFQRTGKTPEYILFLKIFQGTLETIQFSSLFRSLPILWVSHHFSGVQLPEEIHENEYEYDLSIFQVMIGISTFANYFSS